MCFIEYPPKVLGCRTFEEDVIEGCEALTIFTHRMIFKCLFVLDNMIQVLPQEGHSCIIWNASGNPPHLRIPWGIVRLLWEGFVQDECSGDDLDRCVGERVLLVWTGENSSAPFL